MSDKGAIWAELMRVTTWWATEADHADLAHKRVLHDSTLTYADAVRASGRDVRAQPTRVADDRDDVPVLPFSKSKGKTPAEASTSDLEWILPILQASLSDPSKAKFATKNAVLCAAIEAELTER